ncbi:MAG: tetratricopeptide (TPR) repeat protein [Bradymonadia bacterium]|jgi:tetratricopeptide (TPR) repeat protein
MGEFVVEGDAGFGGAVEAALLSDPKLAKWSTSAADDGRLHWRLSESEFLKHVEANDFSAAMQIEPTVPLAVAMKHMMLGEPGKARAELRSAIVQGSGDTSRLLCVSLVAQAAELIDVRVECLESVSDDEDRGRTAESRAQLASALMELGERERALECAIQVEVEALEDRSGLLELLYILGDFEAVRSRLRPGLDTEHTVRLALAEGRYQEVLDWDTPADIPVQRGAALVCLGRHAEGLKELRRGPQTDEAEMWIAEAELKLGSLRSAEDLAADVERRHGAFAAHAVRMAATARGAVPDVIWSRWTVKRMGFDPLRGGAFAEFGDDRAALSSRRAARMLFDSTLHQMRGIRVLPLSRWDEESASLRLVEPGCSTRERSSGILSRFSRERDVAAAESAFAKLQVDFPWSPFPWTYYGELLLWLGRVEDGRTAFVEALKRSRTRWAFVGFSLCELLRGNPRRAKAASRLGVLVVGSLPESTATGVQGEAEYELGNYKAAVALLAEAIGTRPGRVGARTNLALTYLALGDEERAQGEWEEVSRTMPALANVAVRPSLKETLLEFRRSLLGNRSSWFRSGMMDGEFRVFHDGSTFVPTAREIRRIASRGAAIPARAPVPEEQT